MILEERPVWFLTVFLAPHEWGNATMQRVAEEILRDHAHADHHPLVVTVHEHGGWFLIYALLNDQVVIVGSANDMAVYAPDIRALTDRLGRMDPHYIPCIRRPAHHSHLEVA